MRRHPPSGSRTTRACHPSPARASRPSPGGRFPPRREAPSPRRPCTTPSRDTGPSLASFHKGGFPWVSPRGPAAILREPLERRHASPRCRPRADGQHERCFGKPLAAALPHTRPSLRRAGARRRRPRGRHRASKGSHHSSKVGCSAVTRGRSPGSHSDPPPRIARQVSLPGAGKLVIVGDLGVEWRAASQNRRRVLARRRGPRRRRRPRLAGGVTRAISPRPATGSATKCTTSWARAASNSGRGTAGAPPMPGAR